MADDVSLKEYFDLRLAEQERAVSVAMTAAEKAVAKAELAAEKRFESINEFRAAYQDLISAQVPRTEYAVQHKSLEDKVDALADRLNSMDGRSGGIGSSWGVFLSVFSMIVALVGIFLAISR